MDISLLALRSSVDLSQSISFFNDCKRTSGSRQSNNWIAVDAIGKEKSMSLLARTDRSKAEPLAFT